MFSIAAAEAPPAGDGPQEGDILLVTTEVVGFPVPSGATWFTTTGAGCKEQQWSGRIREYINNQRSSGSSPPSFWATTSSRPSTGTPAP